MPANFDDGVFGNNLAAWHKQGQVVAGTFSLEEAFALQPNLDFEVELHDAFAMVNGVYVPNERTKCVVRINPDGTMAVLGNAGPEYRTINNRQAFSVLEKFAADKEIRLDTFVSVDGGAVIACCAQLADSQIEVMKGDKNYLYMNLVTSHNGKYKMQAFGSNERMVCENTIAAAIGGKNKAYAVSMRHSGDIDSKLSNMGDILARLRKDYAEFMEWQKSIAVVKMDKTMYQQLMDEMFPGIVDDDGKPVTKGRAVTIRDNKMTAVATALRTEIALLPQFTMSGGGDAYLSPYTWLNAITRWQDHDVAAKKDDAYAYAVLGTGDNVKADAVNAINKIVFNMPVKA